MVRIEFQNTLDDYREASGMAVGDKRKSWLGRVIVWGTIVIPLTIIVFVLRQFEGGDTTSPPFPWARLALVLTPSVLLFALFAWALLRAAWKLPEPWNPPPRPSRAPRGVTGWLMFFAMAAFFYLFFILHDSEAGVRGAGTARRFQGTRHERHPAGPLLPAASNAFPVMPTTATTASPPPLPAPSR